MRRRWSSAGSDAGRKGTPGRLPFNRPQLHGSPQHRSGRSVERDVLTGVPAAGKSGDVDAERRPGAGHSGLRKTAGYRHLELRVGREQGGRVRKRSDPVLGRRRQHVGHPAVSREFREPKEIQRHRPTRRPNQANRRRQGWTVEGGIASRSIAHWCARHERRRGRCALQASGRDQDRAARGDVRRRSPALTSADPEGRPGGDSDQRRRTRHSRG